MLPAHGGDGKPLAMVRGEATGGLFASLGSLVAAPTRGLRYRLYCVAFAGASVIHLLLPDALEADWLVPNAAYWLGAALIAVNGCPLGWMLSAVGLLGPLLFLGDQLTQSVYLLACAGAALFCLVGPRSGRARRFDEDLPAAVGTLTVGVYAIAALHKMNSGFLDPALSCANGGLAILADNWALALGPEITGAALWPPVFLVVEVTVAVLLVARPVYGMVLATAMHIPLTIVFAPSFAFTMISGWVCLLREDELAHLMATMRRHHRLIVGAGAIFGIASLGLYLVHHWVVYPWWSFKEGLLWVLLFWLVAAWATRRQPGGTPPLFATSFPGSLPGPGQRTLAGVVGVLWLLNGLTPYTGLRYHQAGAMLSNLRIDQGCWNSAIFPEGIRLVDPYVRVDEVTVGGVPLARGPDTEVAVGSLGELEATLRGSLWNPGSLERLRQESCGGRGRDERPISVSGTYEGEAFSVENLCETPWPLGRPALPRLRGFQENLARECTQACIH